MSRVSELAREEAERAEAEQEPVEPAPEPEPEPEPEARGKRGRKPPEEQSGEAQMRAFEREQQRHEQQLREIMGDDFEAFIPCDFCGSIGFRVGQPLRHHPERETCEKCGGYGQLTTGSLRAGHEAIDCEACGGSGSRTKAPPMPQPQPGQPTVVYIDPNTGLPVQPPAAGLEPPPGSPWAPGYTPQPAPVAPGNPQP